MSMDVQRMGEGGIWSLDGKEHRKESIVDCLLLFCKQKKEK